MQKLYRNVLHIKLVISSQMEVNFLPYFKDLILPFLFYEVPKGTIHIREAACSGKAQKVGVLKQKWVHITK